ncbi:hypothetical protein KUTeg_024958 [Tegillarca granosa]|uniref:Plastocyanin-like domain-containing protein n=1 Tax=Tegillarca granosa TaxID=220873 RepID=A0ABQ9E3I2_TEGGR|nr:hypothetical protein KUTeg_024958 [Tegillarca granosa]
MLFGEHPKYCCNFLSFTFSLKKLNPMNSKATEDLIHVVSLNSKPPVNDPALKETPDKKFYIVMDFNPVNFLKLHHPQYYPYPLPVPPVGGIDAAQINYITNVRPPAPLLTQYHDVPQDAFCNADTIKQNCTEEFCECLHMIKVGLGETVEFVMIDEGKRYSTTHPMHLHGQYFRVIGMDRVSYSAYYIHYNPGFWFFHCHIQFHQNNGMSMVVQVGELNQMPKPPKNFPQCRPWKFSGFQEPGSPSDNECTSGVSKLLPQWDRLLLSFLTMKIKHRYPKYISIPVKNSGITLFSPKMFVLHPVANFRKTPILELLRKD